MPLCGQVTNADHSRDTPELGIHLLSGHVYLAIPCLVEEEVKVGDIDKCSYRSHKYITSRIIPILPRVTLLLDCSASKRSASIFYPL